MPVICLEDGSVRFGDEAPKARDVHKFLEAHPGYTIARPDLSEEEVRRRCKIVTLQAHMFLSGVRFVSW